MNNRVGHKTISARLSLKNLAETVKIVNKIKEAQSEVTPTYNKSYILFSKYGFYKCSKHSQRYYYGGNTKYKTQERTVCKYFKASKAKFSDKL